MRVQYLSMCTFFVKNKRVWSIAILLSTMSVYIHFLSTFIHYLFSFTRLVMKMERDLNCVFSFVVLYTNLHFQKAWTRVNAGVSVLFMIASYNLVSKVRSESWTWCASTRFWTVHIASTAFRKCLSIITGGNGEQVWFSTDRIVRRLWERTAVPGVVWAGRGRGSLGGNPVMILNALRYAGILPAYTNGFRHELSRINRNCMSLSQWME